MPTSQELSDATRCTIQVMHEATLVDLLQSHNSAVQYLLAEWNEYLHERYLYLSFFYLLTYLLLWPRNEYAVKLGYDKIEFSDVNHITPPRPILPYSVRYNGDILMFCGVKPHGAWARYPVDVCITTSSIDT